MFYIGQEVVCINNKGFRYPTSLKQGGKYIIQGIQKTCHAIIVNVGIKRTRGSGINCATCNRQVTTDEFHWFNSNRFAPIESIPASHEIAVKKLIEESQTILN